MIPLIGIAAAVVVLGAIALLYNRLVGLRNKTRYTWADCDAVLTRRAQAIPRLVEVVRGSDGARALGVRGRRRRPRRHAGGR